MMQKSLGKLSGAVGRGVMLLVTVLALLAGLWAGLVRMGWQWPLWQPLLPGMHGPLMISGFLGTLISLERAVALRQRWAYLPALLTGLGGVLLWSGFGGQVGIVLIGLGSLGLVILFGVMVRSHWALHTAVMAAGALLWLVGNVWWLLGTPLHLAVWWWAGFLILTIAGERLELSRVMRLPARVKQMFGGATAVFLIGLLLTRLAYDVGLRVLGVGMLLLAAWLLRYDLARHNIRKPAITGYIAVCLMSGYVWLGISGLIAVFTGAVSAGLLYDALLHTIFLGFVFGMIFAHAPIIFPAITGRALPYRPWFYVPLLLLQVTLGLRVAADVWVLPLLRQWGGLLNALVLLLFFAVMAAAVRSAPGKR